MEKKSKIIIISILILIILCFAWSYRPVDSSLYDVKGEWAEWTSNTQIRLINTGGTYNAGFKLTFPSTDRNLYYEVYDRSTNRKIKLYYDDRESDRQLKTKDGDFEGYIKFNTFDIEDSKMLDVCFDKGNVCKTIILPSRKIGLSISPSKLSFNVDANKLSFYQELSDRQETKEIIVKNNGHFEYYVYLILPKSRSSFAEPGYSMVSGFDNWQLDNDNNHANGLRPGEELKFKIKVTGGDEKGLFREKAYVRVNLVRGSFDDSMPHYDKELMLETRVR